MATVEVVGEPRYVLTLTKEEARTLLFITNRIAGDDKGRRGHMDSIGRALYGAGLKVPSSLGEDKGTDFEVVGGQSVIYFAN